MPDTVRTQDQLITLYHDNVLGEISAQTGRDTIATLFGHISSSDPTENNDEVDTAVLGSSFSVGSRWNQTSSKTHFICVDSTPGAAVWVSVPSVDIDPLPQSPGDTFLHRSSDATSWELTPFGTGAGTVCQGNDSRMTNSRAPSGDAGGDLQDQYPNPTVANNKISYAKMQDVSSGDKILGRISGSGDPEEIVCTSTGRTLLGMTSLSALLLYLGLSLFIIYVFYVDSFLFNTNVNVVASGGTFA